MSDINRSTPTDHIHTSQPLEQLLPEGEDARPARNSDRSKVQQMYKQEEDIQLSSRKLDPGEALMIMLCIGFGMAFLSFSSFFVY